MLPRVGLMIGSLGTWGASGSIVRFAALEDRVAREQDQIDERWSSEALASMQRLPRCKIVARYSLRAFTPL